MCKYRVEPCELCGVQVLAVKAIDHLNLCPGRNTSCLHCKKWMKAGKMGDHEQVCSMSPASETTCICGEVVLRRQLKQHIASDLAEHVMLQSEELLILKNTASVAKTATFVISFTEEEWADKKWESERFVFGGLAFRLEWQAVDEDGNEWEDEDEEATCCMVWLRAEGVGLVSSNEPCRYRGRSEAGRGVHIRGGAA